MTMPTPDPAPESTPEPTPEVFTSDAISNVNTSVGANWKDYMARCIPHDAGFAQIDETKMAFYAGAVVSLVLMTNIGRLGRGDLRPEEDIIQSKVDAIQKIQDEITETVDAILLKRRQDRNGDVRGPKY